MKKTLLVVLILTLVMLLTMTACGVQAGNSEKAQENSSSEAFQGENTASSDIEVQLNLIYSQLDKLMQKDSQNTWYYTVADLDHDGNLEFIAASLHPNDRSTNLRIWGVSNDRTALIEYGLDKDPEESFPDIMTDVADVFYDSESEKSWATTSG